MVDGVVHYIRPNDGGSFAYGLRCGRGVWHTREAREHWARSYPMSSATYPPGPYVPYVLDPPEDASCLMCLAPRIPVRIPP